MRTKDRKKIKALIETRRKQILDAATGIFSVKGFASAQVDDIAILAGLGKGTIYRYFKDKKNLFLSVVDRGLDKLKDAILTEVEKTDDPLKKVENAIKTYLSFFEKNRNLIGILIHEQSSFQKRIAKRYFEHYYGNVDRIKQTFKAGIEQGLIKDMDIESAIGVLTSILNGLIYMWQIEGKKKNMKRQDSTEKIGLLLQKIIKTLHTQGKKALMEEKLTFPQYYALSLLDKNKQYKMSTLKRELSITGAGATGIADQLIKKGLAKRERSNEDRRIVNIRITDKGKKLLESVLCRRKDFLASILKKVSTEKRGLLMKALEIFALIIGDGPKENIKRKSS